MKSMFKEGQDGNNMQNTLKKERLVSKRLFIHSTYKQTFTECWHMSEERAVNETGKISALLELPFQNVETDRLEGR